LILIINRLSKRVFEKSKSYRTIDIEMKAKIQDVLAKFDWRNDWMLFLIVFMFVLIGLFEWRERYTFPTSWLSFFSFKTQQTTTQESFLNQCISAHDSVPFKPTNLPWRDWKKASAIGSLVPSIDRPGSVQWGRGASSSALQGGRWGYAPPMMAVEAATPVEGSLDEPSPVSYPNQAGQQVVGMVSQIGSVQEMPNCERDLFEESVVPRRAFSWQPGRTRVATPLSA
jgi:hypothetical protein